VKEPTIAKSPSKTMTKKVEEVNKKETAKVKKEEKVATVPKTKMEKKEADKKVIKRPALKKSSQKKKPDPLVDYLNSKGLAVNGEEVDEEAILNYNKQKGQSILFSLLEEGNPKVMKKILTKKVSSKFINETNDDQKTILHLACEKGNYQLVDYILYRSPNVNAQDTRGWTPLHYAISSGNTKIVKLLKRHKANPSIKNKGGNNAIKFAKKFGTREMVSILRK